MILGIDEVGRGPWAGPLVVGAVVLGDARISGLADSKVLSKKKREVLAEEIVNKAASYGLGWVTAQELDSIGLSDALRMATNRALQKITVPYHEIIIDGTVNFLAGTPRGPYVTTMKKADTLIAAVSAAAILAKVTRDDYMTSLDDIFKGYFFGSHSGYGTAKHLASLQKLGVTSEHRRSFAPIAALLGTASEPKVAKIATVTSGMLGEDAASMYLSSQGHQVLERNWKTRYCEIDLVSRKGNVLYFVEVKHRRQQGQGGGLAAITPTKLKQMKFAAEVYMQYKRHSGDAQLAVIATSGEMDNITVDTLLTV